MRFQHQLMLAACALAATLSCRKDKDSEPPRVRILAPGAGFSVSVPDTFAVSVAVSDDHLVKSLTILIADADGVPITAPIVESVNARSKELTLDLPILDERVESGQFQIIAMANDGSNTARDFVAITVNAAPLRIRSTFLIPGSAQVPPGTIWRIDSTGAMSEFLDPTDLSGALVDPDYLFTAGSNAGPLQRWPLNGGGGSVLMANTAASTDYFRGLTKDPTDNRIYVCTADGQVHGFNRNGVPTFSGFAPPGFVGESLVVVGNFVICSAINPVTQERVLVKHAYQTGNRIAEFNALAAPIAMYARDSQHVLLFGNSPAGGHILDVNIELGGAFEMRTFPAEQIRCVERFGPHQYMLAFTDGIRRFDRQTNSVISVASGIAADGLTHELVSGAMVAANGSMVLTFDPATGSIVGSQTAPMPVGKVLFQYNR